MLSAKLIIALAADRLLGEVSSYHPLVGFGYVANRVEQYSRQFTHSDMAGSATQLAESTARERWVGVVCWCLLVLLPTVLLWQLQANLGEFAATALGLGVLYFCIGGRSLVEHANAVAAPLLAGDLTSARQQLSRIVSRDTAQLDAQSVTRATVESVLENGSDAVLAPIFWFVVAGAPGVLCYRLANTLDAMWGYRNTRFLNYGRTAARMDDALNWLPARCCALSYAVVGDRQAALRCWRTQAPRCDSPNAGPVMASGAGALGILLGGEASYGNVLHQRPTLGEGRQVEPLDVSRALTLVTRAAGLWLAVIMVCELLLWL